MTNPRFTDDDLQGVEHLIIRADSTSPGALVRIVPAPEYMSKAIMNRAARLKPRSSTGRAPRTSTNTRTRGSRRTRTTAPSRGDPDGDPDPGGPARADQGDLTEGRHCLGCGHSIDQKRAQALYCNEACRKRYVRAGRVAAKPVVQTDVIPLATVLGQINKTATVRQAAWRCEIEADTQALTRQLSDLWHEARRARALGVIA